MNQKGFAPIVVFLILLGILVVGGGAWYLSSKNVPPQSATSGPQTATTASSQPQDATANWPVHTDAANGFEIKYPADFPVEVLESKDLSVDLPGTFGGRFTYQENAPISSSTTGRVASETVGDFTIDYWAQYGGMGSWDTVINAWTKRNGNYYIISLNHEFISGAPGFTPDVTETTLISKALSNMHDGTNTYVNIFHQILYTFRFVNPS
ncbi:MAG: hypothetical protein ABSF47_01020 [Minisyncoccia bacterium]|jgi:hypothetical protein